MKPITFAIIFFLACVINSAQAANPTAFSGVGLIESKAGGFKFPDGSVQLSAITPPCSAITYLPYTITVKGVYCLTSDLEMNSTSGIAISINADNVVINLNGWMLDGLGAGTGTLAKGIYGNLRENITIRNGTVRGFRVGIQLEDLTPPYIISKGHIIENIRADQNTIHGFWIDGRSNIIRNNLVIDTGNGTSGTEGIAVGIRARGPAGRFLNNDIINTTATESDGYGLRIAGADGAVVEGNRIDEVNTDSGTTYGIHIDASSDAFVANNRISTAEKAVVYSTSSGKYRDNLTSNVSMPYTGGTDSGGNN